ncbi:OpgC domain-containing protein [Paracoccus caeni]|uniref:OpgC domain-containing protein n=1 Tax=Paracoccus caeni TaxID=657651 RepID=A0A934SAF4_9RHOB|nr:OpgC domain-containing protein [Paracoccus caeni]MBK4215166.1 OpgC domain-containing protein [Paracoccus caeni]
MKRLIALDMLRGYALVCIMVDHMPLSPLRNFTLANFSVFDAAELFVLLSGFLVGMVWLSVEKKQGRVAAQKRFAWRAFEVWRALIIGGFAMALLSAWLRYIGLEHTAVWFQYAIWVLENPFGYLGTLATMWLQPNLLDVLALYVILIASAPLLVPVLQRWPFAFAAGSLVLWWFAIDLNVQVPNHRASGGLLFNPFGWQLLFYSGVAMGLFRHRFMPVLLSYRRIVTIVAAGFFLFGCSILIALQFGEDALPVRNALKVIYGGSIDKWNMDFTRYLAIMGATWLVAVPFASVMEKIAATRGGVALQEIGKGGLWSFIMCVLLSVVGDAFQMNPGDQPLWRLLTVDAWAILTLWWLSVIWLAYGAPWKKARQDRKAAAGMPQKP